MQQNGLTVAEIDALAAQIEAELRELNADDTVSIRKGENGEKVVTLPEKQAQAISAATGEPADRFWARFKRAARKDLCQEGGKLYAQWQKWRDLQTKDVVKVFSGVLAGMGISGEALLGAIVAVGAVTLHIVSHIGISAICEEGENKCPKN